VTEDFWLLVRVAHLLSMAFFVGGQLLAGHDGGGQQLPIRSR
jgi:hypothetical protein